MKCEIINCIYALNLENLQADDENAMQNNFLQ